jgi:hypothetical protein
MKRFQPGDLAITCNSRAPSVNDGHLVTIVEVLGPRPDLGLEFAYLIERVDGQAFGIVCQPGTPIPGGPARQAMAGQQHLRPLRDPGEQTAEPLPPLQLPQEVSHGS